MIDTEGIIPLMLGAIIGCCCFYVYSSMSGYKKVPDSVDHNSINKGLRDKYLRDIIVRHIMIVHSNKERALLL